MISELKPTVFSKVTCELGEGPLWHPKRQSLFWLDILNKLLYEKHFDSQQTDYDHCWPLPWLSSALAVDSEREDMLWLITEHSFGQFDLNTGQYTAKLKLPLADSFRSNDGGVAPNGDFWFGSMEKHPTAPMGTVYSITPQGQLHEQLQGIGIPNTFAWSGDQQRLLLSDSLQQCMYAYQVLDGRLQQNSQQIYLNLQHTGATPDGGAIDQQGNLWNAQWDGRRVICYSPQGQRQQSIELPVPKPSSCCFGGPENRHLFITSAREGMSTTEQAQYPLSGQVFVLELPITGIDIKPFHWQKTC